MPKEKSMKATKKLRHDPLKTVIEKPLGKLKAPKLKQVEDYSDEEVVEDDDEGEGGFLMEEEGEEDYLGSSQKKNLGNDDDSDEEYEEYEEYEDNEDDLVEFDGDYVAGAGLSEAEEAVVSKFLSAGRSETRTLADIIMDKIKEKEEISNDIVDEEDMEIIIPPKVSEVYTAVGKMLQHYKSGKLPKALKMLPHLKNWEQILWLTRPDLWSPTATYACTKIFSSNLNAKMTQRFLNLVLLEKCRDDIRINNKLNYHLYMALKKALYKPAAFYKGLLLPLAQSRSCNLREATIISSVLSKVSIPSDHSAAAILRLAEMPYSGSTSLFIKVLLNKKYALPKRVIESLVQHFYNFEKETRILPVIWHQSFLVFAQRYKNDLDNSQKERLKSLLKIQIHHQITPEIRRELFNSNNSNNNSSNNNKIKL